MVYKCASTDAVVKFEWDPNKAAVNFRRHGVRFAEAATILEDEAALTITDGEG